MWSLIGRAGLAILKGLFTTKAGIAVTSTAAGAVAERILTSSDKPQQEPKDDEDGLASWLSKKFLKHALGVDTDKFDWKQGLGMLVVGTAIAGMGRSLLGDNIVSTVASLALGAVAAFGLSGQIRSVTDGISSFFNDSSGSTATKEPTPPALQQRQNVPALPAPAP